MLGLLLDQLIPPFLGHSWTYLNLYFFFIPTPLTLQISKYLCVVTPSVNFSLESILYIPQPTGVCYGNLKKESLYLVPNWIHLSNSILNFNQRLYPSHCSFTLGTMGLFFIHLVCCYSNVYYLTHTRFSAGGREFSGEKKQIWPLPHGV